MKKTVKVLCITASALLAFTLIFIAFLNFGIASSIAESVLGDKTGCDDIKISGLHLKPGRPFPTVRITADSVYFEDKSDTLAVRVRDLKATIRLNRDSIFVACSTEHDFVRFGSNRIILDGMSSTIGISRKDSSLYGTRACISINESKFISTSFPIRTRINGIDIKKDTDDIFVNRLSVRSGVSDIDICAAAGNIADFISGKGDLNVALDIQSGKLNVNELLAGIYYGTSDKNERYSTAEEENESFIESDKYVNCPFLIKKIIPLIIPDRLKMSADLNVGEARVAIFKLSDFSAHLDVADKTARASECTFNSNFGSVNTTLYYSSPSKERLLAGADLQLRHLTAKEIMTLIPHIDGITPLLKSFKGEFECKATMTSQVDTAFIPIVHTAKGVINFRGRGMSITDAGNLRKYTSLLMFRNKNIGKIDDVNMYAIVSDNSIKVFPMTLGADRYLLAMSGSHSFKNAFDYDISILKSPVPFKFGISLHNDGGKSKVKFRFKKPTYLDENLPTFYEEVSRTQKRLSAMMTDVLKEGAAEIHVRSSRVTKELFNRHRDIKASSITESETAIKDSVRKFFNPIPQADTLSHPGH